MHDEKKMLLRSIQIALFTALTFVGTMVSIPLGASKVHLGNFVCLLAGILCGPWVGAIAGSFGMGINDIFFGYPYTTYLRTFILKFLMGFIVGWLFRFLLKKNAKGNALLFSGLGFAAALFAFVLIMYFVDPNQKYSLTLVILAASLFFLAIVETCFIAKLPNAAKILGFSLLVALSVNVIGEFFLRYAINLGLGFDAGKAMLTSYLKLPGALGTSLASILGVTLLFYPLYEATRRVNSLDDLAPYFPKKQSKDSH
ncbi:MAG: ECF transporter S component [Candidatus Enteromonas sp.]|nr:ECF transporter S component [Candidatus Enteromonas sp.]